jgi:metal-responsive CopG/Arc/MetJ family transcriptional regulator
MEKRKDIYGKTMHVIADITPNERGGDRTDRIKDAITDYLKKDWTPEDIEKMAGMIHYALTRNHGPRDTMTITKELVDGTINQYKVKLDAQARIAAHKAKKKAA